MNYRTGLFLLMLVFLFTACKQSNSVEEVKPTKPNVIYILADDLGYGDLGCYGQKKFETPNIDKLAAHGIKFTQHYSGSTVCAPSRSSLLSGEHTGHTYIRGNKEYMPEGQEPLADSVFTIAELMKQAGYTTGAFGKWGLGFVGTEGDPNNQGFDEFYGYNCQRQAHRYYPEYLWHNNEKVHLEGNDLSNTVTYAQDVIQDEIIKYLENNKDTSFFLFLPYVVPHAEMLVPNDSILQKFMGKYKEEPFVAKEGGDYGPGMKIGMYCSQEHPFATFAAMVTRLDIYVGQIVEKLEQLGIADNTIIMFTSDNGPHNEAGAKPKYFNSNGGLRGKKRDLYEGGIRVPFIVSWPGKIKEAKVSDHISAFWDVMPTLAEVGNVQIPGHTDGVSFLPTLLGSVEQPKHEYLYWEFHEMGGRQAVRKGDWKAVRLKVQKNPNRPVQLYNLADDPKEKNNVAKEHPEIAKELAGIMAKSRTNSAIFNFGSSTFKGE
ncbi:MAG: arylsulfatase [Bacteroidales bacterium]|nr:arylsulfatase [Bacteroidales bacterium]